MIDLQAKITQSEFGNLIGVSQPAVSDMLARKVIAPGGTAGEWLLSYCNHLRETAAGRAAQGDLDLAGERARLAKEQADRVAMQNAVQRGELAPVAALESVLSATGARVGRLLDALPGQIARRAPDLPADALTLIERDIASCRNLAAEMRLADLSDADDAPDDDAEVLE